MKNKEVLVLDAAFKSLESVKSKVKFSFAVAKNKALIYDDVEALKTSAKLSEEFETYEKCRIELAKEYSTKDDSGNPIIVVDGRGSEVYDIADNDAWLTAFNNLKVDHKEAIEARELQMKEYAEILEEDTKTYEFKKVSIDFVPELEAGLVEILMPMLDD